MQRQSSWMGAVRCSTTTEATYPEASGRCRRGWTEERMAETVTPLKPTANAPTFVRQRVLATLGQRILSSHYPPGSTLPTEAQLCAEFGVSRTAMREAIKMLAAKG